MLALLLTALASASSLFLVAVGLSLIFGVTRVVNFAHGSFYLLGAYLTVVVADALSPWSWGAAVGFWLGLGVAVVAVAALGAVVERAILRPLYRSPPLYPLLATFGVVLIVQDVALYSFGPDSLLGPQAPGLTGFITIGGQRVALYDLFLIILAPLVMLGLHTLLHTSRWGRLVRATAKDATMVAALGHEPGRLRCGVMALGAGLAALGGAVQLPKGDANLLMDLNIIAEAFVVTVVGGMGSILGTYLAALLISAIKVAAIANAQLTLFGVAMWQLELVAVFLVMAVVLLVRPQGLLGQVEAHEESATAAPPPLRRDGLAFWGVGGLVVAGLLLLPEVADGYTLELATEALIWGLFAASLQWLTGQGGLISFGHAVYWGLGAYGAALVVHHLQWPMGAALATAPLAAALGGVLLGGLCARRSGVYLAMLTLAFAQIVWSIAFQWVSFTGGDNGLVGIWPARWVDTPTRYYYFTLAVALAGFLLLRRLSFGPWGFALRATRDSPRRAAASGINVGAQQRLAFAVAGGVAGLSGGLLVFLKGSVAPDVMAIPVSVDVLVVLLLGGVETLLGPWLGAGLWVFLKAQLIELTLFWRGLLGLLIIALVAIFPVGIVGLLARWRERWQRS